MEIKSNDKQELSTQDLEAATGGAICLWENKQYSTGASVTQANNTVKTCDSDGNWR